MKCSYQVSILGQLSQVTVVTIWQQALGLG